MPNVNVTDDGVAVLVWRTNTRGIALVFSGDGTLTLSQQLPGRAYVDEHEEIRIDDNAGGLRVTDLLGELR